MSDQELRKLERAHAEAPTEETRERLALAHCRLGEHEWSAPFVWGWGMRQGDPIGALVLGLGGKTTVRGIEDLTLFGRHNEVDSTDDDLAPDRYRQITVRVCYWCFTQMIERSERSVPEHHLLPLEPDEQTPHGQLEEFFEIEPFENGSSS